MEFERRTFLKFLALIPLLGFRPFCGQAEVNGRLYPILQEIKKEPAFKILGEEFLPREYQEMSFFEVEKEILRHLNYSGSMDREAVIRVCYETVRKDFSRGQIVNCKGWQLSKTEVLLAALCKNR